VLVPSSPRTAPLWLHAALPAGRLPPQHVVEWSRDGTHVAVYVRESETVEVWPVAGGERAALLRADLGGAADARFVGAASRFLVTTSALRLRTTIWDIATGSSAALPACKAAPGCFAASDDGTLLAYLCRPASVDELIVVSRATVTGSGGGSGGESWRVLVRRELPCRDAAAVRLCRNDTALLVQDDALAPDAWVVPLMTDSAPVRVPLARRAGADGAAAGAALPGWRDVPGLTARCSAVQRGGASAALFAVGQFDGTVTVATTETGDVVARLRLPPTSAGTDLLVFEEVLEAPSAAGGGAAGGAAAAAAAAARSRPGLTAGERATRAADAAATKRGSGAGSKSAVPVQRKRVVLPPPPSSRLVVRAELAELAAEADGRRAGKSSESGLPSTGVSGLCFSPSGRFCAWRDAACPRAAVLAGSDGTALHSVVLTASGVRQLRWRPGTDGSEALLVVTSSGKLVVAVPADGSAFLLEVGGGFAVRSAAWSPDGSSVLVHNGEEWQLGCVLPQADG